MFSSMSAGNPSGAAITQPDADNLARLVGNGITSPLFSPQPLQALPSVNPYGAYQYAQNPYLASATYGSGPALSGYAAGLPQLSNIANFSKYLSPADIAQIKAIQPGLSGLALANALPKSMGPQAPDQAEQLSVLVNQLQQQYQRDPNDAFIKQQYIQATQAYNTATMGPYWALLNSGFDPATWPGVFGGPANQPNTAPLTKGQTAAQYGYAQTPGPTGNPDFANVAQTLNQAGWDTSQGFAPQVFKDPNGNPFDASRQKELNDLLYSISPRPRTKPTTRDLLAASAASHPGPYGTPPPGWAQAQADAQTTTNAYVNDTLGGHFYGGVIPPAMHSSAMPPDPWTTLQQNGFSGPDATLWPGVWNGQNQTSSPNPSYGPNNERPAGSSPWSWQPPSGGGEGQGWGSGQGWGGGQGFGTSPWSWGQ